jgi:hypothetical protein
MIGSILPCARSNWSPHLALYPLHGIAYVRAQQPSERACCLHSPVSANRRRATSLSVGNRRTPRSASAIVYHLFHSVRTCPSVRRKLERGGPDHPGPLRKHTVWPRHKRRPTLFAQWILRLRFPGAVGRPCLPLRMQADAVAGPRTAHAAGRLGRFQGSGTWPVAARPVSAQASGMPLP